MDNNFYTLTGYNLKQKKILTNAMEDYLEMIYRMHLEKGNTHIKDLATSLNVRASSVTKMMNRLKSQKLINFEKYGLITLSEDGIIYGKYLLYRHEILVRFLKFLNKENYKLEQVEKIEHFVDSITVQNIETLMKSMNSEVERL